MPSVILKYKGKKAELHLKQPALTKEYHFTDENGMQDKVDTKDAKRLVDRNPGMFEVVKGEVVPNEDSLFGGAIIEEIIEDGQDGSGGDDSHPGEAQVDDTPTITDEAVEAARKAMEEGGYKLPATVKKPEKIMEHYQKFLAQKAEDEA